METGEDMTCFESWVHCWDKVQAKKLLIFNSGLLLLNLLGSLCRWNLCSGGAACFMVVAKCNVPFSPAGLPLQVAYQGALAPVSWHERWVVGGSRSGRGCIGISGAANILSSFQPWAASQCPFWFASAKSLVQSCVEPIRQWRPQQLLSMGQEDKYPLVLW